MRCIKLKLGHVAIEDDVDAVVLPCGRESVVINRLINYRAGRIVNLPLATINIDTASLVEVEVNAMRAKSDLAN